MKVQFKYIQASKLHEGAVEVSAEQHDQHEIVRAVVQHVANETSERISFSMLNPAGTVSVGTNLIEPEGDQVAETRTVESIEIAQPGGDWGRLDIVQ
jgi:hypothetical protein